MEHNKKMSYSIKRVRIRDVIQESEVKRLKWKEKWLKGKVLDSVPQRTAFCELKDPGSKRRLGDKMRYTEKLVWDLSKRDWLSQGNLEINIIKQAYVVHIINRKIIEFP